MGFWLFILVNAILFIRPAEIVPGLNDVPIYQAAILACLVISFPRVLAQFCPSALAARPITVCVLGLWLAAILSHLVRLNFAETERVAEEFGKVVVYYLLFVGLVDTPERLRRLLLWVAALIAISAGIAVLQFHEVIQLPGLETHVEAVIDSETEEPDNINRLCGPGIFSDPNDLCLALTLCLLVSLYELTTAGGRVRFLWTAPALLAGYAMLLTQSRGGLLGLLAALLVLMWTRYGWRKTLLVALVVAPGLLFASARQTNFDLSNRDDTAQMRIQLWSDGLQLFRTSPLFGIGQGVFADEVGFVAHNSFIHAFSELGFVGGSLFLGAFLYSLSMYWRLARVRDWGRRSELDALRPFLFAMVAGLVAGMMSLSRQYSYFPYILLGLSTVYFRFAIPPVIAARQTTLGLFVRFGAAGVLFLLVATVFVTSVVRWD